MREGLEGFPNIESISETADPDTWTCRIRMQSGRLPDPGALDRHLREMRVGASLRGVEATADGVVTAGASGLMLKIARTGETLRLAPAAHSVYWDVARKRARPLLASERASYARLRGASARGARRVRVVGLLRKAPHGGASVLQVRSFLTLTRRR